MKLQTQVLKLAQAIIGIGYCKESYATDKEEQPTTAHARDAVCFCPAGAIIKATLDLHQGFRVESASLAELAISVLAQTIMKNFNKSYSGGSSLGVVASWSDDPEQTKDDVVTMFGKAIELSEMETG